jgi:hypothetical protein
MLLLVMLTPNTGLVGVVLQRRQSAALLLRSRIVAVWLVKQAAAITLKTDPASMSVELD